MEVFQKEKPQQTRKHVCAAQEYKSVKSVML